MTRIEQAQEIADRVAKPTPMAMKAAKDIASHVAECEPDEWTTDDLGEFIDRAFAPALDWNRRAREAIQESLHQFDCILEICGDVEPYVGMLSECNSRAKKLRALIAVEQST